MIDIVYCVDCGADEHPLVIWEDAEGFIEFVCEMCLAKRNYLLETEDIKQRGKTRDNE